MMKTNLPNNNISSVISYATTQLTAVGIESARLDVLMLLETITDKPKSWILAHTTELKLDDRQLAEFNLLLSRRLRLEPLAYIIGTVEFYGLDLTVNKHTLIPRSETEDLANIVINEAPKNSKLIDIGTGSGALAVAVGVNRSDISITATDISQQALEIAQLNASKYSLHDIKFINSDIMNDIKDNYDFIVANLPYIPAGRNHENTPVKYEPSLALYSGIDGLNHYRRLFAQLEDRDNNYRLVIEAEPDQHNELILLAKKSKLKLLKKDRLALHFASQWI